MLKFNYADATHLELALSYTRYDEMLDGDDFPTTPLAEQYGVRDAVLDALEENKRKINIGWQIRTKLRGLSDDETVELLQRFRKSMQYQSERIQQAFHPPKGVEKSGYDGITHQADALILADLLTPRGVKQARRHQELRDAYYEKDVEKSNRAGHLVMRVSEAGRQI